MEAYTGLTSILRQLSEARKALRLGVHLPPQGSVHTGAPSFRIPFDERASSNDAVPSRGFLQVFPLWGCVSRQLHLRSPVCFHRSVLARTPRPALN